MRQIVLTREVAAPADRLWRFVSDLEVWAEMTPGVTSLRRIDTGEIAVGARFAVRQPGLPRAVYEVTEWSPETSFTWAARSPGITTTAVHTVDAADTGEAGEVAGTSSAHARLRLALSCAPRARGDGPSGWVGAPSSGGAVLPG